MAANGMNTYRGLLLSVVLIALLGVAIFVGNSFAGPLGSYILAIWWVVLLINVGKVEE